MQLRASLLSLLAAPLAAQTFVVDAGNGPGTNFTSIVAAVAAVPDGSTLLVRPGQYAGFLIQSKGLTVLGGPGVVISQTNSLYLAADIAHLAPNQSVTLRGLQLTTCPSGISVRFCRGAVVLEDIAFTATCIPPFVPGSTVGVFQSDQVLVRHCSGYNAWSYQSTAVFESCTFVGSSAFSAMGVVISSEPGLVVQGGVVQLVDCTLSGGAGHPYVWLGDNQPAVQFTGGSLRVLAPGQCTAGTSPFTMPLAYAIAGTGALRVDPLVVLQSSLSSPIDPAITAQTLAMPSVLGTSASPGGTLSADALGPVGSTVILVVGLPGAPVAIAGIQDPFWVEPAAYAFVGVGVPQVGVPVGFAVPVPNQAWTLGLRFAWQSAALTPSGFEASNPTLTLVR